MHAKRLVAAEFHRACFLFIVWATLSSVTSFWSPGAQARDTEPFYYWRGSWLPQTDANQFKTKEEAYDNYKQSVSVNPSFHPLDLFPSPSANIVNGVLNEYNWHYNTDQDPTILSTGVIWLVTECGKNLTSSFTVTQTTPAVFEIWCSDNRPDPGEVCETCPDAPNPVVAGNPIVASTGFKLQTETDYKGNGLEFTRTYRSDRGGWRHNYQVFGIDFMAPPAASDWPDGACLPQVGSGLGEAYCFPYRKRSNTANDFGVQRGNDRMFNFGNNTNLNPPVDVNDRATKLSNGWSVYNARNDSTEFFDFTGRLNTITARNGQVHTLTYSDGSTPPSVAPKSGLLIRVTNPFGRQLNFTYDSQGRLATMTDPSGGVYTYAYDEASSITVAPKKLPANNLTSVTYPDGLKRTYWYNEQDKTANTDLPSALTGITDENGVRFATWTYNAQGRALTSEHAGGVEKFTVAYPSPNSQSTISDPLSTSRTYNFSQPVQGVVKNTGVTQPAASGTGTVSTSVNYDSNGNVSWRTDFNGNRTNFSYDLTRNLETQRTEGLTSAGANTPQTRTISTEWHPTFRLPTRIAQPLRLTTNVYDADGTQCGARGGLCSRTVQATNDANGALGLSATPIGAPRTWTYTYNSSGRVLSVDGPRIDVSDVTAYTYYADDDPDLGKRGNVATITNALGHRTDISAYNAHGQPLTMVDANALTTTFTYDDRRRLKTRTVGSEQTSYDYDLSGLLVKVTLPDGSFLTYGYDPAHRLTSITDNQGNRIAYTLDNAGNRTLEQVFDPANALAKTRSRVYNNLNRLFQELGALNQTTEYGYDNQGNVTSVKDPLLRITGNQYDPLNRLKQVTDPGTGVTQYGYNGLDALTQVTDPRSLATAYTVDGLGNLTRQASPDTGNTDKTYDEAGNLLTQTDAKGQRTTYTYDALNRVTLITFHDGSRHSYAYDQGTNGVGRLSSITETDAANQQTSLVQYTYTSQGRVNSETRTVGGVQYVLGYAYDVAGRLSGLTYPSGRTLTYSFDSLGRVSGINTTFSGQTQPVVSDVAYFPFGGAKSYTLGNGQVYTRSYDQDGRISTYSLGAKSFAIGYDAASRIGFISELGNAANINNYGYDNVDRLTSAVTPGTSYGYTYDLVGNRRSKTVGASTDTLDYSTTTNRIATLTPGTGPVRSFVFDANGSTTNDGVSTYAYDTRGRMVQATSVIGPTNYQVNALGQRIRKTNSQTDTVFHYDTTGHLIAETSPAGAFKREYIYLGDIPVGVVQ